MEFSKINDEVYYSGTSITKCNAQTIENLKLKAAENIRKRVRLCSHPDMNNKLHEMLIIHEKGCYVRPHMHPNKSESMHIIEGKVDIVFFEEDGSIKEIVQMGEFGTGLNFYMRTDVPVYHTLLIQSDVLIFHETTNGPFNREQTVFAKWSPEDSDLEGQAEFISSLTNKLNRY